MSQRFLEEVDIMSAFVPVDMQTAANNGDWINLAQYESVVAVLFKAAGTAGDDPVFKLQQATDNAGSGAKDINFTNISSKVGTLTSVTGWTRNTQTAATSYTDATSAESQAIIAVEVSAEELDASNDFTHIQLSVADTGSNAQLGCGFYLGIRPRYAGSSLPDATA